MAKYYVKQVITTADGNTIETEPQEVNDSGEGYIEYDSETATLTLGKNGDPSKVTIDNDSMDVVVNDEIMQTIATDGLTGKARLTWYDGMAGETYTNELVEVFKTGLVSTSGLRSPSSVAGVWSHAEGYNTEASGQGAHAEGGYTIASNYYSHAEGDLTTASGISSHAEGEGTQSLGLGSHAEGSGTSARRDNSHSEGSNTAASGISSHAEGQQTVASGEASHAEGFWTKATTNYSHSEGSYTEASGYSSHAEGCQTSATGDYQHVAGKYNIADEGKAEIIGNGTDNTSRSNARTLDWEGNEWLAGTLTTGSPIDIASGGTGATTAAAALTNLGVQTGYCYVSVATAGGNGYADVTFPKVFKSAPTVTPVMSTAYPNAWNCSIYDVTASGCKVYLGSLKNQTASNVAIYWTAVGKM